MRKISVYPGERVYHVIGDRSPQLNAALECWSTLIEIASKWADGNLDRAEWNYLADTLNGTLHEPSFQNPGELLAGCVRDAQALNGTGWKWFGKDGDKRTEKLATKLETANYAEAWSIILAVQFFWQRDGIDQSKEEWWTVEFRHK